MDHYRSFRLGPALSPYIDCVWAENFFDQPDNGGRFHLIVPDNSVELVISEHRLERHSADGAVVQHFTSHLTGLKTRPQRIKLDRSCLLSVRFRPHGLARLTGMDVREFVDRNFDPEAIFGRSFRLLEEALVETKDWQARLDLIERYFLAMLHRNPSRRDRLFDHLLSSLEAGKGQLPIGELANKFNVSIKTLERKCLQHLGVSPKKYSRLVRLFQALSTDSPASGLNLTDIAYQNGYYDQMHFIKEVKHFTGMVPGNFFQRDRGIQQAIFNRSQ
ncbi:AraC family transcriptional regulator [Flavilitoribacter nigricans]|nr:AraC family transcriptional regulator [Flavilitoribacter nigricans]